MSPKFPGEQGHWLLSAHHQFCLHVSGLKCYQFMQLSGVLTSPSDHKGPEDTLHSKWGCGEGPPTPLLFVKGQELLSALAVN